MSPIGQDYRSLGPIYLQAGGREILVDMIRDFASLVAAQGGSVRLDVWPQMNHEFHAYGAYLPESREALACLRRAVLAHVGKKGSFVPNEATEPEVSPLLPGGTQNAGFQTYCTDQPQNDLKATGPMPENVNNP